MPNEQRTLFQHLRHPHIPRNVNEQQTQEQDAQGINTHIAIWLTRHVGTMTCAYLFAGIGIGSLIGAFTGNTLLAVTFGALSSYFLQLVLLPVLSVGQNVLGRKQELLANEQFATTNHTFYDTEQIMAHLSAQDAEILQHTVLLTDLIHVIADKDDAIAALLVDIRSKIPAQEAMHE